MTERIDVSELAAVSIEFDPAELLVEIVREIINDDQGPPIVANAILDGTDQLDGNELAGILDEIIDELAIAADNNREGEPE